jgi:ribosome-associated protein
MASFVPSDAEQNRHVEYTTPVDGGTRVSDNEPIPTGVPEHALLRVSDELAIPLAEFDYRATRSGGPGGQHVNTSSTRVELAFDVGNSPSLSAGQRTRIMERLASRIDSGGLLRLASSGSRSQYQNREDVTERLARMLADALRERKPRKRTRPPRAAKEARLREKKNRARIKKDRGPVSPDE